MIVVNCLILGRAEAFASQNGPLRSTLDAAQYKHTVLGEVKKAGPWVHTNCVRNVWSHLKRTYAKMHGTSNVDAIRLFLYQYMFFKHNKERRFSVLLDLCRRVQGNSDEVGEGFGLGFASQPPSWDDDSEGEEEAAIGDETGELGLNGEEKAVNGGPVNEIK